MARIVVVGGGLAGIATAARLAKQRHDVVLCERAATLGGALRSVEADGFCWDGGPATTTLPAVLRDLFRKTGRPIEREIELRPVESPRRHHFADDTVLELPITGRGAQTDALADVVGAPAAARWTALVDAQAQVWDVLRRRALETSFTDCTPVDRSEQKILRQRLSLHRLAQRALSDDRLRALLRHPTVFAGSEPRDTPAYLAVEAYLERTFGLWRPEGGMAGLLDALTARLTTRKVEVRTGAAVVRIDSTGSRASGVVLDDGARLSADVVVAAVDPRALYSLLGRQIPPPLQRLTPAVPPTVTHLGLGPDAPTMPFETVLHGDPLMVVRAEGPRACTVLCRGALHEDVLVALTRRGLDLRHHVVARVDRSAAEILSASGGSPYGIAWRGPRTVEQRAAPSTPIGGVFCTGASAHPGAGVALVGLGAAQVAEAIRLRSLG